MLDTAYDPKADAIDLFIAKGTFDHTEEADPFFHDVDLQGRLLGIEILSASQVLAPGTWQSARRPELPGVNAAQQA